MFERTSLTHQPRRARLGASIVGLGLLSGCTVVTPLPLTPIQIIEGTWPAKATAPVAIANKPHSIAGDVFSYPALKFSITRPSKDAWEFIPAPNAVIVRHRTDSTEPRPVVTVQILALPADLAPELAKVKAELEAAGATITASAKKVSGFDGESWAIAQKDQASGIEVQRERIYVPVPVEGVQILALVQAEANKIDFAKHQADFDKIINSIVLPGAQ